MAGPTPQDIHVGGAAVGVLTRLAPWQADCILNLRLWCDGPQGRRQVRASFQRALGPEAGEVAFDQFGELTSLVTQHAHRPLVRRMAHCPSVGVDERVFCHLIDLASAGNRTDARLTAGLLVRAVYAKHVAALARDVGQAHRDAALSTQNQIQTAPTDNVVRLH